MADLDFSDLVPGAAPAQGAAPAPVAATAPAVTPLSHGDVAFDDLVPPPSGPMADVAKSAGTGLAKGAMGVAGGPGDVMDAIGNGFEYLAQRGLAAAGLAPAGATPQSYADIAAENRKLSEGSTILPRTADIQGDVEHFTGPMYQPQTTAGKYAQAVGEFLPGAALMPGNTAVNLAKYGALPAVASEAAGQATAGTPFEIAARLGAAALAPGAMRAVTPFPISADRSAMIDTLTKEGVPLTAGQTSGNRPLQYAESTFSDAPGSGGKGAAIEEAQRSAFTSAILRRLGTVADNASPEVLADTKSRIGGVFNTLSARNTAKFDPQFGNEIGGVLNDYDNMTLPGQQAPIVQKTVDGIMQLGGSMPGTQYQAMRSNLDKAARAQGQSNPTLSNALFGIRNALDGAMNRSITPEDQEAWQEARSQWGRYKVVEKAATGAGANAAMGNISPSALRAASVGQNRGAYATGTSPFGDLARAGEAVMTPLPNSGTAQRMGIQALGKAFGALVGGVTHGTTGALEGEAFAPVGESVLGRVLMSDPMQAYLKNQILAGPTAAPPTTLQRLIAANSARQSLPPPDER